jgi:hypothetical protein
MTVSARTKDLIVQSMDNEVCVYDLLSKKCHVLNTTSALVWKMCDGRSTIAEMAAKLEETGLPADQDIVLLALDQLQKADLLAAAEPKTVATQSASRRSLIKKLGAVAGAAALLPLIDSIAVPNAYAQASSSIGPGSFFPGTTPSIFHGSTFLP